jgi:hypothetical protein
MQSPKQALSACPRESMDAHANEAARRWRMIWRIKTRNERASDPKAIDARAFIRSQE